MTITPSFFGTIRGTQPPVNALMSTIEWLALDELEADGLTEADSAAIAANLYGHGIDFGDGGATVAFLTTEQFQFLRSPGLLGTVLHHELNYHLRPTGHRPVPHQQDVDAVLTQIDAATYAKSTAAHRAIPVPPSTSDPDHPDEQPAFPPSVQILGGMRAAIIGAADLPAIKRRAVLMDAAGQLARIDRPAVRGS